MYQLISITRFGESINIDKLEILFVGQDYVLAKHKGFGFTKMYSQADCYTVVTKKIS